MILGGDDGLTIDGMAVGGPAYNCQELAEGDVVMTIDGNAIDADDCYDMLIGGDVPGSLVNLTIKCASSQQIKHVSLTRMAASTLTNHVRLFALFTELKDHAFTHRDKYAISHIDEGIELWTSMLHDEGAQAAAIKHQAYHMHMQCKKILSDFKKIFRAQESEEFSCTGERHVLKQYEASEGCVSGLSSFANAARKLESAWLSEQPNRSRSALGHPNQALRNGKREAGQISGGGGSNGDTQGGREDRGAGGERKARTSETRRNASEGEEFGKVTETRARAGRQIAPSRLVLQDLMQRMEEEVNLATSSVAPPWRLMIIDGQDQPDAAARMISDTRRT